MVNDQFGIKLLYPSSTSNEQYLAFPKSVNTLNQSGILQRKVANVKGTFSVNGLNDTILWYEFAPTSGNDAKLLLLPSSMTNASDGELVLDVDCDVSHTALSDQGYVLNSGEWQNIEMTSHFFIKTVDSPSGYLFFEARNGYDGTKGACCQGTAYGVRFYWDTATDKGKFAFYKKEFTNSTDVLPKQLQTTIPTFYQQYFGAKFCIYNNAAERVKLELWLTPVVFGVPSDVNSNKWVKVGEVEDYKGRGWSNGGDECDAPSKDYPIVWAAPFCGFGWVDGKVIHFNYTSAREIDKDGTFGEDPIPPPDPTPDPTIPNPDPEPPTTPDPQPPDAEPGQTPTTLTRRLTLRREVVNNRQCSCDGVQPGSGGGGGGDGGGDDGGQTPPGGGGGSGGGGGGSGTLTTLYNVALDTAGFARLATVSGSTSHYLRFGQGVTQTNSPWLNKSINRVEITIADVGNPTGGTGGGVHCRIRKGTDDSIAATLSPVATEADILNTGKVFVFENLTNTYKMAFNDKLLFEYDGGNSSNYVKIFRREQPVTTGTKIVWQANDQDAGEYRDEPSLDICARVYTLTP